MKKRIFALALALCMMLSVMPTSFAGNGFLTLDNGEQAPSAPSGILTPGGPVLPEEDLSGEPQLTPDGPQLTPDGPQLTPDDSDDEPRLTLDDPVDEPEDRPARQWRPAPFEEETFTQCDICGYLDGSHAGDCPVVNPPEEQAPAQSTIAEYKPAPMSAATYQDIYDSMMSAETLAEYKAELNALSADLQEAFFSLLTVEEREALSEREDSLAHDALTVTSAENATRTVTVEARASAFSFALHEALRQLGQDLIVSIYGRILESIDLPQNDYTMLETITPADGARYQWQIQADDDLWVDIYNETGSIIRVSYAMVASLLDRYDAVQVRCEITGEDGVSYTDPVKVSVDYTSEDVYIDAEEEPIEPVILDEGKVEITQGQPVEPEAPAGPEDTTEPEDTAEPAAPAEPEDTAAPDNTAEPENTADPVAQSFSVTRLGGVYAQNFSVRQLEGEGEQATTYNVVVNYRFENNEIVADPYTANLAAGSPFSATVTFPTVQGYLPYVNDVQQDSIQLSYPAIDQDYTINVVYKPTNVDYTVIHYQQNLTDDNYTQAERETKQGLTNSAVPDVAKKYDGFYALLYEKPEIAADGSTLVEVYYDRYYYLMNFNLDGGYGVEPIYARFGADINVDESALEKPGYTFDGWDKTIPATMPAQSTSYTAKWNKSGDTAFTVAFYYENADDDGYTFMGSNVHKGTTGDRVNGSDYQGENFSGRDDKHFTYNAVMTDKNIEIKGDGSTVVKVYFSRNEYTMKFYSLSCWRPDTIFHRHSWNRDKCYQKSEGSITAKYNANIAQQYAEITKNHRWCRWDSDACTALVSYMPDNSNENALKYWQGEDGKTVYNVTYAYESEIGTINHDGKKFAALATSHVPMSYVGYELDYKPAVRNGYSAYEVSKAADPRFLENGQIYETNVTLFYYANTYTLRFMNAETELKTANVKYDFSIKSNSGFTPNASYAPNGMVFDCWCLDPAGAQPVDWDTQKMPAGDLVLYARWKPVSHTVEFYLDKDALDAGTKLEGYNDITVRHGSKADPAPETPENGSYTFVGWFYMENGVEKAFDFANMPVTKDMKVYGKWSSNVLKQYIVYYKIQDTDTEIADPATGSGLAGATKTFEAKGGSDLYADYQEGYFPVTKSHSMTLDINATEENNTNVFTFWYVQKQAVPYTVKYLNKETGESVATEKTVSDNRKAVVTETFVPVSGMMPDAYQKRLVVSVDENGNPDTEHNVIIFYYTKDTTHAYYKVTHYTENLNGGTWTEYASSQIVGNVGMTDYSADSLSISGFTYQKIEYVVNDGTPSTTAPALTTDGLEINLYYTRNSYPYQVRYLEQGTGKQLADPKNGTGKYGEVVSESAIVIENYTAVAPTSQTLNIRIEENQTEAKLNIITFYYTEKEVTINYQVVGPVDSGKVTPASETLKVLTGTAQGSTAAVTSNTYRFVGWYKDAACTGDPISTNLQYIPKQPSHNDGTTGEAINDPWVDVIYYAKFEYNVADLTITKNGAQTIDKDQTFIFTLQGVQGDDNTKNVTLTVVVTGNGSVTIKDLPVGDYTISEDTNWSWRYMPSDDQNVQTVNVKGGEANSITFVNERRESKWLDGNAICENIYVPATTAQPASIKRKDEE